MNANFWGVVGPILALAGVVATAAGGVIVARGNRRSSPYEAMSDRMLKLEQRHDDLEKRHTEDRVTINDLQTAAAGHERKIAAVISDRDDVVAYLIAFREWVATGANPPAPRVPLHLRDVIPDWTPDDEDRTTDVIVRTSLPPDPVGP